MKYVLKTDILYKLWLDKEIFEAFGSIVFYLRNIFLSGCISAFVYSLYFFPLFEVSEMCMAAVSLHCSGDLLPTHCCPSCVLLDKMDSLTELTAHWAVKITSLFGVFHLLLETEHVGSFCSCL